MPSAALKRMFARSATGTCLQDSKAWVAVFSAFSARPLSPRYTVARTSAGLQGLVVVLLFFVLIRSPPMTMGISRPDSRRTPARAASIERRVSGLLKSRRGSFRNSETMRPPRRRHRNTVRNRTGQGEEDWWKVLNGNSLQRGMWDEECGMGNGNVEYGMACRGKALIGDSGFLIPIPHSKFRIHHSS